MDLCKQEPRRCSASPLHSAGHLKQPSTEEHPLCLQWNSPRLWVLMHLYRKAQGSVLWLWETVKKILLKTNSIWQPVWEEERQCYVLILPSKREKRNNWRKEKVCHSQTLIFFIPSNLKLKKCVFFSNKLTSSLVYFLPKHFHWDDFSFFRQLGFFCRLQQSRPNTWLVLSLREQEGARTQVVPPCYILSAHVQKRQDLCQLLSPSFYTSILVLMQHP